MPRATQQAAAGPSPEFQLTMRLLSAFRDTWNTEFKAEGVDPMLFSRLSVVALTQLAAVVGVDVGMTPKQFTAVCRTQFDEAHKRAPRFG